MEYISYFYYLENDHILSIIQRACEIHLCSIHIRYQVITPSYTVIDIVNMIVRATLDLFQSCHKIS